MGNKRREKAFLSRKNAKIFVKERLRIDFHRYLVPPGRIRFPTCLPNGINVFQLDFYPAELEGADMVCKDGRRCQWIVEGNLFTFSETKFLQNPAPAAVVAPGTCAVLRQLVGSPEALRPVQ